MRVARSAIGPLLVGLAVWCAAGDVTTLSPDSATARLIVPAAWWWGALGALLALCVPAWRRHPSSAWPALLSTVAWWPIPLPPIALMWTGPLAWAPVGLALVTAWTQERPTAALQSSLPVSSRPPRRQAILAGVASLVASLLVAVSLAPRLPGGDEPHYLIITQSLLNDGDLQIQNNHDRRDYAAYFRADLPRPDMIQRGQNGEAYSIHAPGVSTLVLPAFRVFGYNGAQATVMVVVSLGAMLVWMIGWRATGDVGAAWFAWASISGSATFLVQSVTIFPDGPGFFGVAAAVWLLVRLTESTAADQNATGPSSRSIVAVSIALACLPWLHTRFVLLAVLLGLLIVGHWLTSARTTAHKLLATVRFLALPTVSAIAWFTYFKLIYGTWNPAAPYGRQPDTNVTFVPGGMLGLLFDQQFGLMVYAPVLMTAAGGYFARHDSSVHRLARRLLTVGLAYGAAVGMYWMWWAGLPAPPARFAMAILPLLSVPIALAWNRAALSGRVAMGLLLALSLAISAVVMTVDHGSLLWNLRDANALFLDWAGPVVGLARGWPSFFWNLNPVAPSGEWPFVMHVVATLLVVTVTVLVGRFVARRAPVLGSARVASAVVAFFVVALMTIVEAGWELNRVNGLNPLASQVATLRAAAARRSIFAIDTAHIGRWRPVATPLVMELGRDRLFEEGAAPLVVEGLPPGSYEVEFAARRTAPSDVQITVGTSSQTLAFRGLSQVRRTLVIPEGAERLVFTLDVPLRAVGTRVRVVSRAQ